MIEEANLRLDSRTAEKLERLAIMLNRPAADIGIEALGVWLDDQIAFHESLDEAERQIDRGDFCTQEQMIEMFCGRRNGRVAG